MAKILITGNGFDLSKGLPTSYSDFIFILNNIRKTDEYDFNNIYSLVYNNELFFENFNHFEFDTEKIKLLKEKISINFWFDFFSEELDIETWIDFETKIEYLIKIIITGVNQIEDKIFKKGSLNSMGVRYDCANVFDKNYETIDILNKVGIINGNYSNFSLLPNYVKKRKNYYTKIDLELITKFLITELELFKEIFTSYFKIFIFPLYDNIKNNKINNFSFDKIDYHLTFNYTPTFQKLQRGRNKTYYLHGFIGNSKQNIVLGINDISNEINNIKSFIPFTKYFQKFNNKTYYKFLTEIKNLRNKENHQFFLYGHSLDISDKYYINEIFDFVLKPEKDTKREIYVFYHNESSKSKLLQNLLHIRGQSDIQKLMNNDNLIFLDSNSHSVQDIINKNIPVIDKSGVTYNF